MVYLQWITIGIVMSFLAGCVSTDIRSTEKDALFAAARVSYEFNPGAETRRSGSLWERARGLSSDRDPYAPTPEPVDWTLAVDADFAFGETHDKQQLTGDDELDLRDARFSVPERVDIDYELYHNRLSLRSGMRA